MSKITQPISRKQREAPWSPGAIWRWICYTHRFQTQQAVIEVAKHAQLQEICREIKAGRLGVEESYLEADRMEGLGAPQRPHLMH